MSKFGLITKGLLKENPTFVLVLGLCPTLATTTSAMNGLEMGLATMFVLILSNIVISLIAPVVPDKVHIPVYIVVIATFVTLLQLLMQAYVPDVYETLGLFIPLIVVNCIVLGRAVTGWAQINGRDELEIPVKAKLDGEYAQKLHAGGIQAFLFDCRCFIGTVFSVAAGDGVLAFVMAPGAFLVLGYLMVLFNKLAKR